MNWFHRIIDYLFLVVNSYLIMGVVAGYALKVQFGGRMISVTTGLVIGLLLHEAVKWWALK